MLLPVRVVASALVTIAHGSGAVAAAAWVVGGAEVAAACVAGELAVVAVDALPAFVEPAELDEGDELEQAASALAASTEPARMRSF
jgi:hypothetical protein